MPRNNNNSSSSSNKRRKNQNRKKTKHGKGPSESVTIATHQPSVEEQEIIDVDATVAGANAAAAAIENDVVVADGDITEKADSDSVNEQSSSEYIFVISFAFHIGSLIFFLVAAAAADLRACVHPQMTVFFSLFYLFSDKEVDCNANSATTVLPIGGDHSEVLDNANEDGAHSSEIVGHQAIFVSSHDPNSVVETQNINSSCEKCESVETTAPATLSPENVCAEENVQFADNEKQTEVDLENMGDVEIVLKVDDDDDDEGEHYRTPSDGGLAAFDQLNYDVDQSQQISSAAEHLTQTDGMPIESEGHAAAAASTTAADVQCICDDKNPQMESMDKEPEFKEYLKTKNDKISMEKSIAAQIDNSDGTISYRVESPKTIVRRGARKLVAMKKCRSLDDDNGDGDDDKRNDLFIQELSDAGSSAENENTPLVSETESETESDALSEVTRAQTSDTALGVQTIALDGGVLRPLNMTTQEEQSLRGYLVDTLNIDMPLGKQQTPPAVRSAAAIKREKRAAIQTHFLPQFLNPKCLDVIREENSDLSDAEGKLSPNADRDRMKDSGIPSPDAVLKKANAVYPKSQFDFATVKRHTNLRAPKTEIIREEPQCFLVDTKIIDTSSVEESSNRWTTSVLAGEERHAEIIYLDSSSSCTSVSDVDSAADGDVEDSESEVRIETPTIESPQVDDLLLLLVSDSTSSVPPLPLDDPIEPLSKEQTPTPDDSQNVCSAPNQSDTNQTDNCVHDQSDINNDLELKAAEPCSNDTLEAAEIHTNFVEATEFDLKSDIIRQDSSSSQSTSRSQSTARYFPSPVQLDSVDGPDSALDHEARLKLANDELGRTLRQLCVDQLQSMPYGDAILEELAAVSENLKLLTDKHQSKRIIDPEQNPLDEPSQYSYDSSYEYLNRENYRQQASAPSALSGQFTGKRRHEEPYLDELKEYQKSHQRHSWQHPDPRAYLKYNQGPPVYQEKHHHHYPAKVYHQYNYQPYQKPYRKSSYPPYALPEMPYPIPDLPYIDDLEVPYFPYESKPQPPLRSRKQPRTVTLLPNYAIKSPPPPPVPDRPWLGVPTDDDPSILVCLSPAQRQYMQSNERYQPTPDELLAMHNQFVDRRGYYEYTDDEVHAINFKKSTTSTTLNESDINAKDGGDNKLLALIREINQLTNATESVATTTPATAAAPASLNDSSAAVTGAAATATIRSHDEQTGKTEQCTNNCGDEKMFRDKQQIPCNEFNKRYSSYERYVPIEQNVFGVSAVPLAKSKRFSNIETSRYATRKRVENGNVLYDISDSSTEKSQHIDDGTGDSRNVPIGKLLPNYSVDEMRREFFKDIAAAGVNTNLEQPTGMQYQQQRREKQLFDDEEKRERRSSFETTKNSSTAYATTTATESRESNTTTTELTSETSRDSEITLDSRPNSDWFGRNRFSLGDFDYVPKFFADFFKKPGEETVDELKTENKVSATKQSDVSKETVANDAKSVNNPPPAQNAPVPPPLPPPRKEEPPKVRIIPTVTTLRDEEPSQLTNEKVSHLQSHRELYTSTQSLREWLENVKPPESLSRATTPGVQPSRPRSRISPCVQIRAPRIAESPAPSMECIDDGQRRYDLYTTKHARRYDYRQSMIDETPITPHVRNDQRRQSLPRALHDKQLNYILEQEEQLGREYDQLEYERRRLQREIEEMKVNQSFEDYFRQNKLRNQHAPQSMSQAELFRKNMHDEWLQQVADREERRLHKIIKVTKTAHEETNSVRTQQTKRGLGDEFLDRVKERRTKLQIPSDSDWESGAESQPTPREQKSPKIDPNVMVVDGGNVADIKQLPRHIKEFAEVVTKEPVRSEEKPDASRQQHQPQPQPNESKNAAREIIHQIRVEAATPPTDGESSAWNFVVFGMCIALAAAAIYWKLNRSVLRFTNIKWPKASLANID